MSNYTTDFYAWANHQAELLRTGKISDLDRENIAEELEDLGKSQKKELHNRLVVLIAHLLKWQFQPQRRSTSWEVTIDNQRLDLNDHLEENPSLSAHLDDAITRAYKRAVGEARKQTRLKASDFPTACPYTTEEIVAPDYWPSATNK